ncbi:MAG: NADH-quinone oxidoreductase subunit NuoH [Propionibacteriaceae bacterium]
MTPLDLSLFGNDPWWVIAIKAVLMFVLLLLLTLFNIWFERRVVGKMQHRKGPTMNGPFGLLQSLADGMKLMFKEDITPTAADRVVFTLAPFITAIPAFTAFAVIPFGGTVKVPFTNTYTQLQLTDLPMSILLVVAIASVGVYGIVLAGWSSGSTYSLLGGLRSSAQVISYEVAMGLSFVAVFLYAGSMSTSEIVIAQATPQTFALFGAEIPLPSWYAVVLFPSFVIYAISMVGETNRAQFELAEAEGELVGGFHTEYSGMRFAMFFLAEYINMVTVSALAVTMFLGGYRAPLPFNLIPGLDGGYWGIVWFLLKVMVFMFVFVWLRGTLPRMRYDQFMRLGWRWLIPISLGWIVLVATFRVARADNWFATRGFWLVAIPILVVLLAVTFFGGKAKPEIEPEPETEFDAFAGGYPVPPMPGQQLPELAGVVPADYTEEDGAFDADLGPSRTQPAASTRGGGTDGTA